ncbi:MAG: glycoside hydrolase family 9 protein [Ruminococcus sp.]|nr:glycoside hydrolase family 9 protein [Ruminococcus sp.]
MKNHKRRLSKITASATALALSASALMTTAIPTVSADSGDADFSEALALSLYFFDSNQCGKEVDDNPLTWRGNCHVSDSEAKISSAVNLGGQSRLVDPDGDGKVDVSGGYHDAGDHIKFNLTIGFGMNSLALSDYLNPGAYEKAGCRDHLLYILRNGADYMMKTTFLDNSGEVGAVCYMVSNEGDHSYWGAPENQTGERPTYWLTPSSNNSAIALEMASALAGTAVAFKDTDASYAAECTKYAKALYRFGTQHTGNYMEGMGSMYATNSQYQDEQAMTEGWLYILGEGSMPSFKPTANGCYNYSQYDYYLYSWDKVWSGYAAMMYKATGDSAFSNELLFEVNNMGGLSEGKYNTCRAEWGCTRYNCAVQMEALATVNGNKDASLAKGAKYQMNYILGNNSYNKSFLTGYGNSWSSKVHHRAANPGNGNASSNPDAKYVNYGYLIGGPDSGGTFNEVTESYRWTEGALDYNGCFALACAALVNLYGSNGDGASRIVNNASEFKKNYSFGNNSTPGPIVEDLYPEISSVEYSSLYHQIKFTWKPVEGAQNYGIAVYLAGKWRIQTQSISASTTTYTTPKNLTPGKTYRVAIAAKVNGQWTAAQSIKNAVTVTVK